MRPELFHLYDLSFPAYFVLLLTGFLFATALGSIWAKRIGENPDVIVDLGLAMLMAGVVGARILHVLADGHFMDYVHMCTAPAAVDWPFEQGECVSPIYDGVWDAVKHTCHPKEADCFAWAKFWAGGLTYYGGFVGAVLAAWFLLKRDGFPFWRATDMAGFTVPLGLAFGRMGCLLAGCCFGSVTRLPWGLSFPPGSPASEAQFKAHDLASAHLASQPVHPTEIYESFASLLIAIFCLYVVHPRKRYDGQVFVVFVVLYAVMRFILEFVRMDERGGALGLSTSQWIGILLLVFALGLHLTHKRRATS